MQEKQEMSSPGTSYRFVIEPRLVSNLVSESSFYRSQMF